MAASGTGDISGALTNTTSDPVLVTFTVTPATNGCTGASITATVLVNPISAAPTGATGTTVICNGASTTLTVAGGSKGTGAITEWFTGSCGGTLAGTGDAITVSPTVTTTYYVRYSGTCNTTCASVTVKVNNCLSINNVKQSEGNAGTTNYTFTVSLTAPAIAGGVSFDIATANNTATTSNNDYMDKVLTGQTIPEGVSTYTFVVAVNGDNAIEPDENFFVNITNVTGATITDDQGIGTITNDDFCAINITGPTVTQPTCATPTGTIVVNATGTAATTTHPPLHPDDCRHASG